jgi:hypothetical protein
MSATIGSVGSRRLQGGCGKSWLSAASVQGACGTGAVIGAMPQLLPVIGHWRRVIDT